MQYPIKCEVKRVAMSSQGVHGFYFNHGHCLNR